MVGLLKTKWQLLKFSGNFGKGHLINRRQQIGTILRLVLSVVLLGLLFNYINIKTSINALVSMNPGYYAVGVVLYFISVGLLWAFRWYLIIRATGQSIRILKVIEINLIGGFFSIFLPTAIGGDLVRMYELSRQGGSNNYTAVSTVFLDRLVGLISLVVMAIIALMMGVKFVAEEAIIISVLATSIVLVIGWWLLFNRTLMRKFVWIFKLPVINRFEHSTQRFYQSLYDLHRQPRLLASTLSVALIAQTIEIFSVIFMARALNLWLPAMYYFIFIPIIWVVTTLPFSLGGLGLREGAFALLFNQVGVAPPEAVAMSLLVYSCRVLIGLVGGLVFLKSSITDYLDKRKLNKKELSASLALHQD